MSTGRYSLHINRVCAIVTGPGVDASNLLSDVDGELLKRSEHFGCRKLRRIDFVLLTYPWTGRSDLLSLIFAMGLGTDGKVRYLCKGLAGGSSQGAST